MKTKVKKEVVNLHRFFQDWFSGKVENSQKLFNSNVRDHFDAAFEFVTKSGAHFNKTKTVAMLKNAYGYDPKFKIKVSLKSLRKVEKYTYLVVFEERQIDEGKKNRRLSVAVIWHDRKRGTPKWLHCQESPIEK